jgi:hypothetical protein
MMMYGRHGGVEVAEIDALTATRNFPLQWTLKPWIRPEGRPDVFIREDWYQMGLQDRIDLARSTVIGRGTEIDNAAAADEAIGRYLDGTKHPGE